MRKSQFYTNQRDKVEDNRNELISNYENEKKLLFILQRARLYRFCKTTLYNDV